MLRFLFLLVFPRVRKSCRGSFPDSPTELHVRRTSPSAVSIQTRLRQHGRQPPGSRASHINIRTGSLLVHRRWFGSLFEAQSQPFQSVWFGPFRAKSGGSIAWGQIGASVSEVEDSLATRDRLPLLARRGGCASKKKARSIRNGADGVVVQVQKTFLVDLEPPPRPLHQGSFAIFFLSVAPTPPGRACCSTGISSHAFSVRLCRGSR